MRPRGRFVSFAEMAEKWGCSEDELIQLAIQEEELSLYCLKAIPGHSARMPFFIGDELGDFLPGKTSILCSQFGFKTSDYEEGTFVPIGPEDRKIGALCLNRPLELIKKVVVDRTDLYLHRDEIIEMEVKYPELVGGIAKFEIAPKTEEPNIARESDARKGSSSLLINDEPVDILPSHDNSELVSLPCLGSETVATLDSRLLLSPEIDKESDLIAQAKKLDVIKQPHNKKVKSNRLAADRVAEQPLLSKDDNELQPLPTRRDLQEESYLRLWDIIGDEKRGIPAIIPVSKTTWWNGVKSGRYPKPVKLSPRCTAWRSSDIYALKASM